MWAVGMRPRNLAPSRKPSVLDDAKATTTSVGVRRRGLYPVGWFDHGTHTEDGPGTWETLAFHIGGQTSGVGSGVERSQQGLQMIGDDVIEDGLARIAWDIRGWGSLQPWRHGSL